MPSKNVLKPPMLEFGDGRGFPDPIQALAVQECPPRRIPGIGKGRIIPLLPKTNSSCNGLLDLLGDLKIGAMGVKWSRCRFRGFRPVFGFPLNVEPPTYYVDETDALGKIDSIARNEDLDDLLVAVGIKEPTTGCGAYQTLKVKCISRGVRSQFFTGPNMRKYSTLSPDDQGTFLWNVGLAVFSKLEGIPWELLNSLQGVAAVIGISTIASSSDGKAQRNGITALEIVNEWGNPIGRFFASHSKARVVKGIMNGVQEEEFHSPMERALSAISESVLQEDHSKQEDLVIVHMSDYYSKRIYDFIENTIASAGFRRYKLIHIKDRSDHRQFDPSGSPRKAWPPSGTWDFIVPDKSAFLYTAGAWPYYSLNNPYVISGSDVAPIELRQIRGSTNEVLEKSDLSDAYQLTRLHYYTSDTPRIRLPITIKLGRRAARLVQCGLAISDFPISFLY